MNSRDYWAQREAEALKHRITDEKQYDAEIKRIYAEMLDACQKEIDSFYGKYASKEGITLAEAKKAVSKLDIAAYERKAKRYVAEKNFSAKANEEMRLYNATMKINRLEMLKANLGLETIAGHNELEKFMAGILQGRTEDELARQAGILGKTIQNNAKKAHAIVNGSFHNGTFSDRIWQYQDLMRENLGTLLQTGLIQGKNPRALTKDLKKYWYGNDPRTGGGATYCMERLMRTELARVQTEAQKQSFERNGFEEYEFIVNGGCCSVCEALRGKHFKVAKMMPGENAPPMHPHCRCSTAAYEDSDEYEAWLDYLSKGGTTEEWNKLQVKPKPQPQPLTNNSKTDIMQSKYGYDLIEGEHTRGSDLAATNPKYRTGRAYQVNCQRCVSAYEARRRGYNVAAKPAPTGRSGTDYLPYMMHEKGWANVYKNGLKSLETLAGRTAAKVKDSICERMAEYGEGARAIVRVRWSRGNSGHVFIAEQVNGTTHFVDPQSGKDDVSYYFGTGMIKPADTRLLRIDDKEFSELIELCAEKGGVNND